MLRRIFIALAAAIVAVSGALGAPRPLKAAPAAQAGALPAAACTLSGTTRTCELWAKPGTLSLPGSPSLPIWGFSESAGAPARLPGPTISAEEGETLVVTVHNGLAHGLSLAVPALAGAPDRAGAAAGADATYTFAGLPAGTFLYQAGPTAMGARQAAMGLFGGLVVRSADPATAYGSAATAFDREALLIFSEVDPALNAAPTTFQLQRYRAKFGLINGKLYPNIPAVGVAPGGTTLLRQINAGIEHRTVGLLGLRQQVIAEDGAARTYPYTVVAETLAPGLSLDTLVRVPATAAAGARYPLYDTAMPQRSGTLQGGMLTFLEVLAGDLTPPAVSGVVVTPDATSGADLSLSATVSDAGLGDSAVAAAEYAVDSAGAAGSGTPMVLGAAGVSTTASATVAVAGLADGQHTVFVRGKDSAGNWSAAASASFMVDRSGPAVSGVAVSGAALTASASDALGTVAAAEYFIGADPGAGNGAAMAAADGTFDGASEGLSATLGDLAPGSYSVSVRARDALGTWGAPTSASFTVSPPPPAALFADGFESGDTSAWSSVGGTAGRLSVTAGAAMNGTTRGLAAGISAGTSGFVASTLPASQPGYRARFYLSPNSVAISNTTWRRIFVAYNSTNGTSEVYRVELQRQTSGNYRVRAVVTRQGGTTATTPITVSGAGATAIEVAWQSGASAPFSLRAGATTTSLTLNTTVRPGVRSVRMGPQGGLSGVSGTIYFDEFVATDGAAIP